jgi:hypothetical protein
MSVVWLSSTVPGYPKVQCDRIPCPDPYMGLGVQPGAPPDHTLPAQDPIGAGECYSCCTACYCTRQLLPTRGC